MADSLTFGPGDPSLSSYALLYDSAGDEIDSTGSYVQGTGITLTNVDYTANVLDMDDIDCGDIVSGTVKYVKVFDSDDAIVITFTLETAIDLATTEDYSFLWPEAGITFASFSPTFMGVAPGDIAKVLAGIDVANVAKLMTVEV